MKAYFPIYKNQWSQLIEFHSKNQLTRHIHSLISRPLLFSNLKIKIKSMITTINLI